MRFFAGALRARVEVLAKACEGFIVRVRRKTWTRGGLGLLGSSRPCACFLLGVGQKRHSKWNPGKWNQGLKPSGLILTHALLAGMVCECAESCEHAGWTTNGQDTLKVMVQMH